MLDLKKWVPATHPYRNVSGCHVAFPWWEARAQTLSSIRNSLFFSGFVLCSLGFVFSFFCLNFQRFAMVGCLVTSIVRLPIPELCNEDQKLPIMHLWVFCCIPKPRTFIWVRSPDGAAWIFSTSSRRVLNPRQSDLRQAGTFEGRSTSWGTAPRHLWGFRKFLSFF